MNFIKKNSKKVLCLVLCVVVVLSSGCAMFDSSLNDIEGKLKEILSVVISTTILEINL